MREEAIVKFLIALGVSESQIQIEREWVNTKCILSPYTHAHGQDKRPSFGIHISENGPSHWWCFGCSPEGRGLHWLLHSNWVCTGSYPWEAAEIYLNYENHFDDDELFDLPKNLLYDPWEDDLPDEKLYPIPMYIVRQYPLLQYSHNQEADACRKYLLEERGIPDYVAHMCKIRIDEGAPGLIFPMTDKEGIIHTLRVRSRLKKDIWTVSPKYAGYPHLKFSKIRDSGALFNLWQIDWRKPVLIVEAELDVMKAITFGFYNAVAAATSSITKSQIEYLQMARVIIMGGDADKGGDFMHQRIKKYVGEKARTIKANWALVNGKDGEPAKDVGDITCQDDFWHCIKNSS